MSIGKFIRQFLRSTFECLVTFFSKCLFFGRYVYHSPSNLYTFILENIFRKYFIEDLFAIRWRTYELSPWTLQKSPYLDKLFSLTNVFALNCSEIIFLKYLLVVKIVIQIFVFRIHKFNYRNIFDLVENPNYCISDRKKKEGHLAWTEQLLRER